MTAATETLRTRQAPLRTLYARDPGAALVTKRARCGAADGRDPFHGTVVPENAACPDAPFDVAWDYGIDDSVGGLDDLPNPGHLLCAALAACEDGVIRMMAAGLGIELEELEVEVSGVVDVRGTLGLDRDVPVGFRSLALSVRVRAAPGTPERLLERLHRGAERLCVNLETLRNGVPVETRYDLSAA